MGFLALDYYFKRYKASWETKVRLGALHGRIGDILFIKPQEFYNDTGRVVAEWMRYYKVAASDILVICDDFNLDFGVLRYRAGGSAGGNNGLKSIISEIGTVEFPRIRVGTGNDELRTKMGDVDFVLSKFSAEEKAQLPEILSEAVEKIDSLL